VGAEVVELATILEISENNGCQRIRARSEFENLSIFWYDRAASSPSIPAVKLSIYALLSRSILASATLHEMRTMPSDPEFWAEDRRVIDATRARQITSMYGQISFEQTLISHLKKEEDFVRELAERSIIITSFSRFKFLNTPSHSFHSLSTHTTGTHSTGTERSEQKLTVLTLILGLLLLMMLLIT
jgi:hypothetical protein